MSTGKGAETPPILATRSGRLASQQPLELAGFIRILRDACVTSYLEIGARHGDTFYEVMRSLPVGSVGVAVDWPGGPWGGNSMGSLLACCDELRGLGYKVAAVFGKSQEVSDSVLALGPFGATLIDADHRYEAVKSDWLTYGSSPIVAFHDIDGGGIDCGGMSVEVPRLWREIKVDYRHVELIAPSDDRRMGIGVIFK